MKLISISLNYGDYLNFYIYLMFLKLFSNFEGIFSFRKVFIRKKCFKYCNVFEGSPLFHCLY